MNDNLILLPVILQLALALMLLFFWSKTKWQRIGSMVGNTLFLMVAVYLFVKIYKNGVLFTQAGDWEAPFGITFVADLFSATMLVITALSGLAVSIFASGSMSRRRSLFVFFPIYHFLLMGISGSFLAGDLFNLYVWFELIIIASFGLITLGGGRRQLEGALKYVTLNLLASILFLTGIAFLYGLTGTLNMADLARKIPLIQNEGLLTITALMFFIGLGIKTAVFPLYFWLPASYHTPMSAVSAIFGGLLTKVGVYALFRVFSLFFLPDSFTATVITAVAALTLIMGAMGALIQKDTRKLFSWLIVCHIGFMIAGLGIYTTAAIAGAVFYLFHDILVKTNLFMISGLIHKISGTFKLKKLGGLYSQYPKITLLIAIPLFSLVGIPPLSGFWPKLLLIQGGMEIQGYLIIAAIILGSFVTLATIGKFWLEVVWKEQPAFTYKKHFIPFSQLPYIQKFSYVFPIGLLASVSLFLGFGAEIIIDIVNQIAFDLMNPDAYIELILPKE
nr:hypothetical protein [Saprospiraceae bacterium]